VEGSLAFITFSDAYKVISMSEVYFGVESGFPGSVQEIVNQWEWITIFLGDLVKAPVVKVFTLPQVALVDLCEFQADSGCPCYLCSGISSLHGSAWIPSEKHSDTQSVLGQFRVEIYVHGLGPVFGPCGSHSDW
jgi:hypothetical protein